MGGGSVTLRHVQDFPFLSLVHIAKTRVAIVDFDESQLHAVEISSV
jgi:hypothetical protein